MYPQSEKRLLDSNIFSRCPHNMVNFGALTAEIGLLVWGTPASSNGFCILDLLLQRRRSSEANQTTRSWSSPRLVHCIHFWGLLLPDRILPRAKFTLHPSLAFLYIGHPLPSNRHHPSSGDCLEGKGENYQVCSVQYCVQQLCTVRCTHI